MPDYILAIDQGTTSTRAMVFDIRGNTISKAQQSFPQYFPHNGWVEHNPDDIWETTITCCKNALVSAGLTAKDIVTIGISNQRETTIVWDKKTGKAIYPAIVWQDRRTAEQCHTLSNDLKTRNAVIEKTGLLIDPYFSATKIAWILDNIPDARNRAETGELLFGTIDTFLLWKLTDGSSFATDATNASRTLLFNIHTQEWDAELLSLFNIPKIMLPTVLDSNAHFGVCTLFGADIPITGIAGDQQAATIGHACFSPGMMKSTYGTGCFVVLNTGKQVISSRHQLLSTIGYRINGDVTYALEGSIFSAGTGIQWLTENLHFMQSPAESEKIMLDTPNTNGVYFVTAFTGLGAPYWDADARAAIFGITRDTQKAHIVRAALEAVCYQTYDLIQAIQDDYSQTIQTLHVDGGMTANNALLQFLSDMINIPITRQAVLETSALGAALLAGLGAGVYRDLEEISTLIHTVKTVEPVFTDKERAAFYAGWKEAVSRTLSQRAIDLF